MSSLTESENNNNKEPQQPDGGFGWVIVIAAFSIQFIVLGIMNNFGLLFAMLLEEFHGTKTQTAWVGSITYGLMFLSGPIATSLCQRLGCRTVAALGGVVAALATLTASFSKNLSHMYLTEGLLFGIGASLCYFPSVLILPHYFRKRLSLVNGIVSCGSGVGTMALGPILNFINESYGWRVSNRLTSVLLLCTSGVSFLYRPIISSPSPNNYKQPLFDFSIFQNKAFIVFTFALFIFMLAYFVPFVHLTQMAIEYGIPLKKASFLIGVMSIASTVGRLFFGHIADSNRVNRLYVYQIALLGIGVSNALCPIMVTFPALLVYCCLFGFFEGCYVCQVAVITGDIVGYDRMAVGVGTLFGIKSIPLTLGAPLAGFIYDKSHSYHVAFYVAGAIPTIASCIMFLIPFLMPPPDHKFWIRKTSVSNKSNLISSEEENSFVKNQETHDLIDKTSASLFRSLNFAHLGLEKRVVFKNSESIASFGSMIITPVVKNKSSELLVIERLTVV
ncbi:monocarboxylate transporter 10 [Hydra vulgaris]|uniref:Monocarboxylate transporter 10 n=1 Tax=Hydra vulgaris TaxID=6087 RepID=A0ABM4B509_HYDVU